ncbi:MAG: hypothetical protein V1755_06685 [Chloroflexota bacterium]
MANWWDDYQAVGTVAVPEAPKQEEWWSEYKAVGSIDQPEPTRSDLLLPSPEQRLPEPPLDLIHPVQAEPELTGAEAQRRLEVMDARQRRLAEQNPQLQAGLGGVEGQESVFARRRREQAEQAQRAQQEEEERALAAIPTAADEERDQMLRYARRRLHEAWFPNLKATGVGLGASVAAPLARLVGQGEAADKINRFSGAYQQAASERDVDGYVPPIIKRGLRGVGTTLPTMVVAGAVAGPYGAIVAAMGQEGDRAITEGRDAGLSGAALTEYAAKQGLIEGIPAAVMQRVGLGGLEQAVGRPGKAAISGGIMGGLKRAGIVTLQEVPEEIITEIGHNVEAAVSGVDPAAANWDRLTQTALDTTVQTLITMGVATSPNVIRSAMEGYKGKPGIDNKPIEFNPAKITPETVAAFVEKRSRTAAKDAGLENTRADQREEIAAKLREAQAPREQLPRAIQIAERLEQRPPAAVEQPPGRPEAAPEATQPEVAPEAARPAEAPPAAPERAPGPVEGVPAGWTPITEGESLPRGQQVTHTPEGNWYRREKPEGDKRRVVPWEEVQKEAAPPGTRELPGMEEGFQEPVQEGPAKPSTAERAAEARSQVFSNISAVLKKRGLYANPLDPELMVALAKDTVQLVKAGILSFRAAMEELVKLYGRNTAERLAPGLRQAWEEHRQKFNPEGMEMAGSLAEALPEAPVTSIKNRIVDELRTGRGKPLFEGVEPTTLEAMLQQAHDAIVKDPGLPERLVAEQLDKPRTLQDWESAALTIHHRRAYDVNEVALERRRVARAKGDTAAEAQAQTDVGLSDRELDRIELAARGPGRAGTQAGLSLAARKIELHRDESLAGLRRRAREAKDEEPLTTKEEAETEKIATDLGKNKKEVERLERRPVSDEKRIAAKLRALDSAIAELEKDLAAGKVMPKVRTPVPSTPEIEAKQARLNELRALRDKLRTDNPDYQDLLARRKETAYERALRKTRGKWLDRLLQGELDPEKAFAATSKEKKKHNDRITNLQFENQKLRDKFRQMERAWERANRTRLEIAASVIPALMDTWRAIVASYDIGHLGRQAKVSLASHPIALRGALPVALKALASKRGAFNLQREIDNDPLVKSGKAKEWGLDLTTTEGPYARQEEPYAGSQLAERHIPGIGASQRTYVVGLNWIRLHHLKLMVEGFGGAEGITDAMGKLLSNYVNVATGRGHALPFKTKGGDFDTSAKVVGRVFFSARYWLSRLQLSTGQPLWWGITSKEGRGPGTWAVRRKIAAEYARYMRGMAGYLGLVYLAASMWPSDDEKNRPRISWDPRSSDFGKIRMGNTRIDIFAGMTQLPVLLARLRTGKVKPPDEKAEKLSGYQKQMLIARYFRGKLAPAPGTAIDLLIGEGYNGDPITPSNFLRENVAPMNVVQVAEGIEDQGWLKGSALGLLMTLGEGGSTYEKREKKRKTKRK